MSGQNVKSPQILNINESPLNWTHLFGSFPFRTWRAGPEVSLGLPGKSYRELQTLCDSPLIPLKPGEISSAEARREMMGSKVTPLKPKLPLAGWVEATQPATFGRLWESLPSHSSSSQLWASNIPTSIDFNCGIVLLSTNLLVTKCPKLFPWILL